MKEYISKDYINNLLEYHLDHWCGPEHYTCSIIQDEINETPADEIIHFQIGKWTTDGSCSVCNKGAAGYNLFVCTGDKWVPMFQFHYCPNCGAKMEADE